MSTPTAPKRSSLADRQILPQVSTPTVVRWFKIVAVVEAISWALLLFGMYMKYLADERTGTYVSIFGSFHGGVFVIFGLLALLTWHRLRWSLGTGVLALISAVPPFFTVFFEIWASRTGRLDPQPAPAATG